MCVQEVAEPFHFPDTITSVSYSLRKAYINHLWDYEQVGDDHNVICSIALPQLPCPQAVQ